MPGRSGSFALDRTPNSDCEVDAREWFHQLVSPRRGYLLRVVLKDLFDKRFKKIDTGSEQDMDALNRAFERIHEMTVQWVECPDRNTAIRAEHCAVCQFRPEYVEK